ncbi:hypothetical protein BpHYR1_027347 [Brachionus plicatilis]|uniref:Uncharacterized protein n=1 Tax=Brachionus plicatilis TaxID=10195 RepID=A0A3M7PXW5_BRAPC|nr:hypothetical protein BpHYR1_027347 [Brachionus plicatilis]
MQRTCQSEWDPLKLITPFSRNLNFFENFFNFLVCYSFIKFTTGSNPEFFFKFARSGFTSKNFYTLGLSNTLLRNNLGSTPLKKSNWQYFIKYNYSTIQKLLISTKFLFSSNKPDSLNRGCAPDSIQLKAPSVAFCLFSFRLLFRLIEILISNQDISSFRLHFYI